MRLTLVLHTAIWTLIAFVAGAIPFSLLVGRLALGTDIRRVGDGNPGATNVLRAGGKVWALAAVILDMGKAALPVAVAYVICAMRGLEIVPIAVAPLLGHIYSPFLRGKGGKGVAVTGGIWIGLTKGVGGVVGIAFLTLGYAVQSVPGWAVAFAMAAIATYLVVTYVVWRPDPVLLVVWVLNTGILLWRHRDDLRRRPTWRNWLTPRN